MAAVLGGILVIFLMLGVLGAIGKAVGEHVNTKEWRPFLGIFIIAGLIAVMGLVMSLGIPDVTPIFLSVAKWVAITGGVLLCLRIIGKVAVSFFRP